MAAYPNEELCQISKGLYRIVSGVIGPECIVKLRRQKHDIHDSLKSCDASQPLTHMTSGSKAEGFEFKSSDFDVMHIDQRVIVLTCNSCHMSNTTDIPTVLLMETEDVSPGFTLLRCLRYDYNNRRLYNPFVLRGNDVYLSSRIARESHVVSDILTTHGPCSSGTIEGGEYDIAYTLRCPFWPTQAVSFIYRSLRHGWPSFDVLRDICKDGCLLVPINSKQQIDRQLTDLEWRISFSLAEKKLIYSMNHCQFLCYGLMKVFLNDILKTIPETGELLCSYFMKTAVFWEISENAYEWSPLNLMYKFWNVFRRVMKWVSIGYCPNFFIPHHNMFYGKIYGRQQRDLMLTLRTLYDEGYLCLLRCTSLQEISIVINQPFLVNLLSTNENDYVSLTKDGLYRVHTVLSTSTVPLSQENIHALMRILCNTATLISTSDIMTSVVKLRINYILQQTALLLHSNHGVSNQTHTSNRLRYCFIKAGQSILRRTKISFCFNRICLAVCTYRSGDYHKTMQIVNHIKRKLQRQTYMYKWNLDDDIIMRCRLQGMSYEAIVKTFVIDNYEYEPELSIEELRRESKGQQHHVGSDILYIPPLVFLNLLLVMSFTRVNDIYSRNDVLYELQTLVCYDDGYHINDNNKAISWEILGICQQLCGDYHGAYQSYIKALNDQYNEFKPVTITRINSLSPYSSY